MSSKANQNHLVWIKKKETHLVWIELKAVKTVLMGDPPTSFEGDGPSS